MSNLRDQIIKDEFSHKLPPNVASSWIDLYTKHNADLSFELLKNAIVDDENCKEYIDRAYNLTPDEKEYLKLL